MQISELASLLKPYILSYMDESIEGGVAASTVDSNVAVDLANHIADTNIHHNRSHNIVSGSDHTIAASAFDVVGAVGTNLLGIITPSFNTGETAQILRTDGTGKVQINELEADAKITTLVVSGGSNNLRLEADGGGIIWANNNFGIHKSNPSVALDVTGIGRFSNRVESLEFRGDLYTNDAETISVDYTTGTIVLSSNIASFLTFDRTANSFINSTFDIGVSYVTGVDNDFLFVGSLSTGLAVFQNGNSAFRNKLTVGSTTPNSSYDLYINGTGYFDDQLTANTSVKTPLLTNVENLVIESTSGSVQFSNEQTLVTSSFDSSFPIEGWQITETAIDNQSSLTIGVGNFDELRVRIFVADETRVDRGNEFWTKSYGIVAENFTTPGTIGGTVTVKFEDSPALSGAIFSNNDWVLFQRIDIDTGFILANVWGQVSGYTDLSGSDEGFQSWTFTLRSGATDELIRKGQTGIDFGQTGAALIHLSTVDPNGAPYIKMRTWSGANPYTPSNFETHVQIGELSSKSNPNYTPTGYGLYVQQTDNDDRFLVIDDNGLRMHGADLKMFDGATQTVNIDYEGNNFWLGQGSSDKVFLFDGTSLSLLANNSEVITLDTSGNSYFAGIMTIGTNGEIRQGTGTLTSDYTGLRIWRDTNVGRIGGYNNDVLQWYADTDGLLYAGSGNVQLGVDGINLQQDDNISPDSARSLTWWADISDQSGDPTQYISAYNIGLSFRNYLVLGVDPESGFDAYVTLRSNNTTVDLISDSGFWINTDSYTEHLYPQSNNTYDVGDGDNKYRNLHVVNLHVDTIVGTPTYAHNHDTSDITTGTLALGRIPTNLTGKNADLLDGYHASSFSLSGHTHSYLPLSGGELSGNITFSGSQTVDGVDISAFKSAYDSHNHDSRYHTQTEINSLLTGYMPITWTLTAGSGLTGGGSGASNRTISHDDTSSVSNSSNSGTTAIQSMTFDTYGHVQSVATADMGSALDSRYVNVTGDTMSGALTVPQIINAVISQPSQSDRDMSMVSYFDRNELVYANHTGSITYNITGANSLIANSDDLVDGTGNYIDIQGTDNTTTQIQIIVDRGSNVDIFGHAFWQPFLAYRFDTGSGFTWYNNVVVEVSADGSTWYKPSGGLWETSNFDNDKTSAGLWIGGYGQPAVPGFVWRYARFTLTDRVENSGYAFKDRVWITAVGVRHVSAPFSRIWLDRAGDTMFGDFVIQTGGVNVFDVDVSAALTTVSGDLDVADDVTIDGVLNVADGSAAAPAINFYDTDTGFYNPNTATIGFTSEGTAVWFADNTSLRPATTITTDLGNYTEKWRTIFAAELYVETLVAQSVLATIGGRIVVAPTSKLIANYTAANPTIDLEHNFFANGDYFYMASAPNGTPQVEAFKVTSGPTTISGGFRYSVTGDQDGTGFNNWLKGDAVVSLGGSVGDGYIDITSTSTIHNQLGPSITFFTRTATTTWNSTKPVVTIGQLDDFVDYSGSDFGIAIGNDVSIAPVDGFSGLTADATNGLRLFNTGIKLYDGATQTVNIDSDGNNIWIGTSPSNKNILWNGGILSLRSNNTDTITFSDSGNASIAGVLTIGSSGGIYQGTGTFASPTTGLKLFNNSGDGRISLFNSGNAVSWYDGDSGLVFEANTNFVSVDNWRTVSFEDNGDTIGFLTGYIQPEGDSDGLLLQANGVSSEGRHRNIRIVTENTGSYSSVTLLASSATNGASVVVDGGSSSSVRLTADDIGIYGGMTFWDTGDLDLNGNDIVDIGTIGSDWTAVSFGSGWGNYAGYQPCQYKVVGDLVILRGLAARTSGSGTTILTLPAGARPPDDELHVIRTNTGIGTVSSAANGVIQHIDGGTTYVSLSGIILSIN